MHESTNRKKGRLKEIRNKERRNERQKETKKEKRISRKKRPKRPSKHASQRPDAISNTLSCATPGSPRQLLSHALHTVS